jgi:hypothetical protein
MQPKVFLLILLSYILFPSFLVFSQTSGGKDDFLVLNCYQKILRQDPIQHYQSHEYYLTCYSDLSFMSNMRSFEPFRNSNSSEITLDKSNFTPPSMSINKIEAGIKSNIKFIFSSEKNLGYITNSNNLLPLSIPNPLPAVKENGRTVGKFFLGALVGAGIGTAIALVMVSQEKSDYTPGVGYTTTGSRDNSMDSFAPWLIAGGSLICGIMFAIKW